MRVGKHQTTSPQGVFFVFFSRVPFLFLVAVLYLMEEFFIFKMRSLTHMLKHQHVRKEKRWWIDGKVFFNYSTFNAIFIRTLTDCVLDGARKVVQWCVKSFELMESETVWVNISLNNVFFINHCKFSRQLERCLQEFQQLTFSQPSIIKSAVRKPQISISSPSLRAAIKPH